MHFHRKSILSLSLALCMVLSLALMPTAAIAAEEELTPEEAAFLSLIDYDLVEANAKYLSEEIGNRRTSSFRRDMTVDWLMDELTSYGYAPYVQEYNNADYGARNVYFNNGSLEVGGKLYMFFGPAYAGNTVYNVSYTNVSVDAVETLHWADINTDLAVAGDFAGKAVIITLPPHTNSGGAGAPMPNAQRAYNAILTLQNAGAAAVLFETPQARENGNTTYSRIANTATGTPITIPVGTMLHYEVNGLDFSGGVKLGMQTRSDGKNVVAVLPSATGSKKTVYITAHFDTMESGPGMNDNGSGVVMQLEMARAFRNVAFSHNIVFLFCDYEEGGFNGAKAYIWNMTDEERENFIADYNMDMISTDDNCPEFHLNISDPTLNALDESLFDNDRLIDIPEALEAAKKYDVFNHSYLAAQKLGFDMDRFQICYDTTTDHYAFVQEATRNGNDFPNMMNAVEYDWRVNKKGTSFELLYHKAGDTFEDNYNYERMELAGDIISLAIYLSAAGTDANGLKLSTDTHLIEADGYANMLTAFAAPVNSNAAILNYKFDTDKLEYADFHPADGVAVISKEATSDGAKVVVMVENYATSVYGALAIHAKGDAEFGSDRIPVSVRVIYALMGENDVKTEETAAASALLSTKGTLNMEGDTNGDGKVDIIDLSNIIDWFGYTRAHNDWNRLYTFFDFNNSGDIDVFDIAYVAKLFA